MKILLINHYAGSKRHGMEFRPYYMSREWVKSGHIVQILAASYSHIRAIQPDISGQTTDEIIDGINYRWYKTPSYHGNGIKRVFNMLTYLFALWRNADDIANSYKPDLIIASSTYPLDIWPAKYLANKTKSKLVFEVHDLWPLSPIELGGISKWNPFMILLQIAENYAYRNADEVVSMLPKVREHMENHGMAANKLKIVQNGIDPNEWVGKLQPLPKNVEELIQIIQGQGNKIIGYAGTHGVANDLGTLLDAAKLLVNERVTIMLVGGGPEKAGLMKKALEEGITNVRFVEPVLKSQIPHLLKRFDIAYLGFQKQPLFRFGIAPNKLMDYMMAKCPILMAIDAGNDPVAETKCGLTVEPENALAIAEGVMSLLELSDDERARMGERGFKYVIENHDYAKLANMFLG